MADFVDEKRREMVSRMRELKPLVDEYQRLEAAAAALEGLAGSSPEPAASRRGATRATATRRRRRGQHGNGATKQRGRPKGSGRRAKEAFELVSTHPGITIPEIAEKMGIKQNYLYRVLPGLQQEGLVTKEGRGWHPRQPA